MFTVLKIKIRNANSDDTERFVNCYLRAYRGLESYAFSSKRDVKSYFRWLMKRDPKGVYSADVMIKPRGFDWSELRGAGFVACDSNWFSKYEGKEVCEIHEIVVDPEWRGMGIGSMLMKEAISYSLKMGREVLELWVGERNYRAMKFYRKFGFSSREKNGYWIRMVKTLNVK